MHTGRTGASALSRRDLWCPICKTAPQEVFAVFFRRLFFGVVSCCRLSQSTHMWAVSMAGICTDSFDAATDRPTGQTPRGNDIVPHIIIPQSFHLNGARRTVRWTPIFCGLLQWFRVHYRTKFLKFCSYCVLQLLLFLLTERNLCCLMRTASTWRLHANNGRRLWGLGRGWEIVQTTCEERPFEYHMVRILICIHILSVITYETVYSLDKHKRFRLLTSCLFLFHFLLVKLFKSMLWTFQYEYINYNSIKNNQKRCFEKKKRVGELRTNRNFEAS